MPENQELEDHDKDKTSCGCRANDATCYCEDGKKKFRPIPSNG